jgi:hypothetical protein
LLPEVPIGAAPHHSAAHHSSQQLKPFTVAKVVQIKFAQRCAIYSVQTVLIHYRYHYLYPVLQSPGGPSCHRLPCCTLGLGHTGRKGSLCDANTGKLWRLETGGGSKPGANLSI